jgi:DNA-binding transcriptional regulator YiaG
MRELGNWKYHFLYKTVNEKNEKYYIGVHSTNDIDDGYLGSGTRIKKSVQYHGRESHKRTILGFFETRETAFDKEKEIVNEELLKDPKCMNIMTGGAGFLNEEYCKIAGRKGNERFNRRLKEDKEFYKEFCKKQSEANIKNPRGWASDVEKYKYSFKGEKHTKETRERMEISNKGKHMGEKNSQFGTIWMNKVGKNIKVKKTEISNKTEDGWKEGMDSSNIKNANSNLSSSEVSEIRKMISDGISQRKIASLYNVSKTSISKISRNETYKQYR